MRREINAHEYLTNVLKTWTQFCKTHRLIAESIESLLNENNLLKSELKEYKQYRR